MHLTESKFNKNPVYATICLVIGSHEIIIRMNKFHNHQILVVVQIILGMGICAVLYWFGTGWFEGLATNEAASRLQYLAPWLLVPAMSVFICTAITALYRLFSADAIDGTPRPASRFLDINLRITRNTMEQAFMAALAWFGLALALPAHRITLIPVAAILFGAGRILFWLGYQLNPAIRALGFTLTLLPTAVALGWLIWSFM